jgi:hypothetical protein
MMRITLKYKQPEVDIQAVSKDHYPAGKLQPKSSPGMQRPLDQCA